MLGTRGGPTWGAVTPKPQQRGERVGSSSVVPGLREEGVMEEGVMDP